MSFVNIHTHHLTDEDCIIIKNLTLGRDSEPFVSGKNYFSVGMHPWYLQNSQSLFDLLLEYAKMPNNVAIGECGLDHLSEFPANLQEEVFLAQIKLAEELQKPLIIHCVRAYNELIRIRKTLKCTVPWVIHGFNANKRILVECLKYDMYISVGNNLILNKSQNYNIIKEIPLSKLFIETDDAGTSIHAGYKQVTIILGLPLEDLKERVYLNFLKVFNLKDQNNGT